MCIRYINGALQNGPEDTTPRFVLVALAAHANDKGFCWPAIETISNMVRMNETTVRRAIRQLEEIGIIRTRPKEGQNGTNMYQLSRRILGLDPGAVPGGQEVATGRSQPDNRALTYRDPGAVPPNQLEQLEQSISAEVDLFGKPITKTDERDETIFDDWWSLYPKTHRKAHKAKCRELFWKTVTGKKKDVEGTPPTALQLLRCLQAYTATNPSLDYVPGPVPYLNQNKWEAFLEDLPTGGGNVIPMTEAQERYQGIIRRAGA